MRMRIANFGQHIASRQSSSKLPCILGLVSVILMAMHLPARAEVKIIEADSTYFTGDNAGKVDARRIAVQEAKRKALEQAGTFVVSLTQVKNQQLTRDEVNAYTAGLLETEIVSEQMRGTTDHPEIYVKARCTIDTTVLMSQIDRYSGDEDLKGQLESSAKENEALQNERDALVRQLAAEKNKTKTDATLKKLEAVLTREETNEETSRIWASLAHRIGSEAKSGPPVTDAELDKASAVLKRAVAANPQNQRAHYLLASIYQRNGDQTAAENELHTAIQRNPTNPVSHIKMGLLLREAGNYQEALREFHFVERMRTRNLPVVFYAGMTLKDLGKCGKAVQNLNRFLKDSRVNKYPRMKEQAIQAIEECGGDRPGRHKRK